MKHLKTAIFSHIRFFFFACCLILFAGTTVIDAKIVFRMGDDIYVMNDDGTGRRRLTKNTESKDHSPRWSPDGKRIAFIRYMNRKRQSSGELFIMNENGKDLQRLTDNNAREGHPSWSPDGKGIVFQSDKNGNGRSEVYVIDLETLDVTQLTGAENELGSVAPTGRRMAYRSFMKSS